MAALATRQACDGRRCTASGGHSPDASPDRRREQDRVVNLPLRRRLPCHHARHFGNRHRRAALAEDLHQSSEGGESEPLAVGREERVASSLGSRNRSAVELIQISDVDLRVAAATGYIGDRAAIGRHRNLCGINGQRHGRRLSHDETRNRPGWGRSRPPRRERPHDNARQNGRPCGNSDPSRHRRRLRGSAGCRRWRRVGRTERIVQLESRVTDVPDAVLRILGEASFEQPSHTGRSGAWQHRPHRLPLENAGDHVGTGLAAKRRASGQHLVEHAPKRPDVGPLVDRSPARLLRAHVPRGAENRARERTAAHRQSLIGHAGGFGDSTIENGRLKCGQTKVEHLDIA